MQPFGIALFLTGEINISVAEQFESGNAAAAPARLAGGGRAAPAASGARAPLADTRHSRPAGARQTEETGRFPDPYGALQGSVGVRTFGFCCHLDELGVFASAPGDDTYCVLS